MVPAAIYARSSRDRADVSISTQVHELRAIAKSRGLEVVETFEDAVESGSTGDRPSFSRLGEVIRDRKRGWSILLVYDTSRIARRRYIAQAFKHECRKFGITIQYAKMPVDIDPISELVLDAVFEAMDEVHSLMSRDKAVAGQRENVRRGWRAGGRAPIGYRLEAVPTGAMREGKEVSKSRLILGDDAAAIAAYLKARARGVPRATACTDSGISAAKASLVGIEWNALVYAGHTVWNRHPGKRMRGEGQPKRRPRDQWDVQRDTHQALITDAQAEAILAKLSSSTVGEAIASGKRAASDALLVGLLMTPEGQYWRAAGKFYRLEGKRSKYVNRAKLEQLVLDRLEADVATERFIDGMAKAAGRHKRTDRTMPMRRELAGLRREKDRAAKLALKGPASATWVALVAERSDQIRALEVELERAGREDGLGDAVQKLTPAALRDLIRSIEDPARLLRSLVARVELDDELHARIVYRAALAPSRSVSVASPRVSDRFATYRGTEFLVA